VELPKSYRFDPPVIEVDPGTTVTWVNQDDFPHTVHLLDGSGVDKSLPVGESTSITFNDPGTIRYDCSLHPSRCRGP
jgi:plastocyanin